ncbi:hypothetical protein [Marinobacterium aestuariivivens]|uniref:Uncharacterized protein n=1 Tax=Marinobacterium aestuariivivens TaxID=1698799 RepID=A0ABW1ZYS5_9GAMM
MGVPVDGDMVVAGGRRFGRQAQFELLDARRREFGGQAGQRRFGQPDAEGTGLALRVERDERPCLALTDGNRRALVGAGSGDLFLRHRTSRNQRCNQCKQGA